MKQFINYLLTLHHFAGRLFYGLLMDRTSYKTAMLVVTSGLSLLVSILPLTWYLGTAAFTLLIWSIYFTFPGTYSTTPN